MTAERKIAQNRLSLLQLADRLRNVSEACRRRGISRSQFYEYKRAFQERGFEGLTDRPPILKTFPNETPCDVKEKIITRSLEHPSWGPLRLSRCSSLRRCSRFTRYGKECLDEREDRNPL